MAVTKIDGRRLVESYKAGDPEAFPEIVREHYADLLHHAHRRLGDRAAAEDAVQEALLRAYRALPRFNGEYRLTAWLHRIVENVCIDEANRRRRRDAVVERLASQRLSDEPAADAEVVPFMDPAIPSAVATLPPAYREALFLREVEGLSYADVAAKAGISEDNARARVSRARTALRRLIGPAVAAATWLTGILRRGDRLITDGGSSSHAAASAASTAATQLSTAVPAQLVSYVTQEPQTVGTALKVAAAVAAIAIPVGSVGTAVKINENRQATRQAAAPVAPAQLEVAGTADGQADTTTSTSTSEAAVDDTVSTTTSSSVVQGVTGGALDGPSEATVGDGTDASARSTSTPPTTAPADGGSEPAPGEPAPEQPADSPVEYAPDVTATELDDGRVELAGPMTLTTSKGSFSGRTNVIVDLPEAGDAEGTEYRLGGSSLVAVDGSRVRIRLYGTLTSTVRDGGGTVYTFTGQFTVDDGADALGIPAKGTLEAVYVDGADGPALRLRLAPTGSTESATSSENDA